MEIMRFFQGKWIQFAGLALMCCSLQGLATASSISNTGVFSTDDQVFQFTFTLSSASTVTVQSFGYGGGINGAGTVISQGGFGTNVALFSAIGSQGLIDQDSDGGSPPLGCGPRNINTVTGACQDGFFTTSLLGPGSYILTLTEAGNPAVGNTLGDGFQENGGGNFTGGPFLDPFGVQLNGSWAVDVSAAGLAVNTTPEPATALLTLLFVPGLAIVARRRRHS
jgi:uncharacterized protein (TIGR03382 family)